MGYKVTAIYEDGVLRLLTPLEPPERAPVEVPVELIAEPNRPASHGQQVDAPLMTAGLAPPLSPEVSPGFLSAERRDELARLFSEGRPSLESIMEERDGR